MYRITIMGESRFAVKLSDYDSDREDEFDQIETLVNEGNPCILVEDLDEYTLSTVGLTPDEVQLIQRDS